MAATDLTTKASAGPLAGSDIFYVVQGGGTQDRSVSAEALAEVFMPSLQHWYYFEHFFNGPNSLSNGLLNNSSGGSNGAQAAAGHQGINRTQSGSTNAVNQRGGLMAAAGMLFGVGSWRFAVEFKAAETLPSGGTSGFYHVGFLDSVSTIPVDGAYFRSTDGGNWHAVTSAGSTETVTDLGFAPVVGTWASFEVRVNAGATEVLFMVDDVVEATHTTNIPSGVSQATSYGIHVHRSTASTQIFALDTDWLFLSHVPNPLPATSVLEYLT